VDAVDQRIRELKSRSPGDHGSLFDFLSEDERSKYPPLIKQRKHLQTERMRANTRQTACFCQGVLWQLCRISRQKPPIPKPKPRGKKNLPYLCPYLA
jgi:hypothetical protein